MKTPYPLTPMPSLPVPYLEVFIDGSYIFKSLVKTDNRARAVRKLRQIADRIEKGDI